jgi:hypothetical protein
MGVVEIPDIRTDSAFVPTATANLPNTVRCNIHCPKRTIMTLNRKDGESPMAGKGSDIQPRLLPTYWVVESDIQAAAPRATSSIPKVTIKAGILK